MRKPKTRKELDELNGKRVTLTRASGSLARGDSAVIRISKSSTVAWPTLSCANTGVTLYFEHIELCPEGKKDLQRELQKLKSDYESKSKIILNKIEFLDNTGLDQYDESEANAFLLIKQLNEAQSMTDIEKAKMIASRLK